MEGGTKTEVCLFLGGPNDGEWHEVLEGAQLVMFGPPDYPLPAGRYRRKGLSDDRGRPVAAVYAHDSIEGGAVIQVLVNGYRNPKGD